jgi:NADH dehydrogenase FAD-containing subunit
MKKTKVIILGGGFGGVYAALRLDKTLARRADVEVTLVSSDQELFVAEVGLAQSRLNELLSLVQLYKALGGGWQQ